MKQSIFSYVALAGRRASRTASACTFAALVAVAAGCQSRPAAQAAPKPVAVVHPSFDQDRAWRYLTAQCGLGPRVPGSAAHEACKDFIVKELTPLVDKVETQEFTYDDTHRDKTLHLTNIIGVINPTAPVGLEHPADASPPRKVMLFTHWDTRPTADQELDAVNKARPIPGADDGASGTAVLMELAHTFHAKRPNVGVVLLFVDGEDWGPGEDAMYLGARYYAKNPGDTRPQYAILLDMIGDKNLQIHRERYSEEHQPEIDNKIWGAAKDLGYSNAFPNDTKYDISDDHQPLNEAGIPAVDLIDFDYPYWHMLSDTPDKCSPTSLKTVGEVCAKVIYDER